MNLRDGIRKRTGNESNDNKQKGKRKNAKRRNTK